MNPWRQSDPTTSPCESTAGDRLCRRVPLGFARRVGEAPRPDSHPSFPATTPRQWAGERGAGKLNRHPLARCGRASRIHSSPAHWHLRARLKNRMDPVWANSPGDGSFERGLRWLDRHSPLRGCADLAASASPKNPRRRAHPIFQTGPESPGFYSGEISNQFRSVPPLLRSIRSIWVPAPS